MKREALADRIVTYSDAVVAFGLVNGLAFFVAMGEPDIRCSIAGIAGIVAILNAIFVLAMTYALVWLRRYELRLRGDDSAARADAGADSDVERERSGDAEASAGTHDPLVDGFWRVAAKLRFGLIWFFGSVVFFGVWAATRDTTCLAGLG